MALNVMEVLEKKKKKKEKTLSHNILSGTFCPSNIMWVSGWGKLCLLIVSFQRRNPNATQREEFPIQLQAAAPFP